MKILLSLILLMSLPAFANCHDAFDPKKEQLADLISLANYKDFKRGYKRGVMKTLRNLAILGAIGAIGAGAGAGYLIGQEVIDALDKKTNDTGKTTEKIIEALNTDKINWVD